MDRKKVIRAMIILAVLAVGVFAFAGIASANAGYPGPSTPAIGDPVGTAVSEVQVVFLGNLGVNGVNAPTGGTFTISFGGQITSALATNAKASDVQTALQKLSTIGANNVLVTGGTGGYMVSFIGTLTGAQGWLSVDTSLLTGPGQPYAGSVTDLTAGQTAAQADTSPHGGFSASTDFCLQCHAVHGGITISQTSAPSYTTWRAPGVNDYALLAAQSVTQVCASCHDLFGNGGAPNTVGQAGRVPQDGNLANLTVGTASVRSAYDTPSGQIVSQHTIGAAADSTAGIPLGSQAPCYNAAGATTAPTSGNCPAGSSQITEGGWSYGMSVSKWNGTGVSPQASSNTPAGAGTASSGAGGLYCASCHTPHGDWGQAVNTRWINGATSSGTSTVTSIRALANDTIAFLGRTQVYLEKSASGASKGIWFACTSATAGVTPTTVPPAGTSVNGCQTWTMTDANGNPGMYLYGYKLLTAFPNHTYSQAPRSYNADVSYDDSGKWCGTCHTDAVNTTLGGTYHNHPTGCAYCHGAPSVPPTSSGTTQQNLTQVMDFPHTSSNAMFLKALPDGLCISCHTSGTLP